MDLKLLFLDTETTGVDMYTSGIHQVSGIIDINGKIEDEFSLNIRPFDNDSISEEALEKGRVTLEGIHGYQEPWRGFLEIKKHLKKFVDPYKKEDKFHTLAYFAEFDYKMLRRFWDQNNDSYFGSWFWHPWIDIAALAAYSLMFERSKISSFQLMSIARYLGIEVLDEKCHDSLYDSRLARDVYYRLMEGK